MTEVAKTDGKNVVATVDDRVEDGVKIHEEKKTTKGDDGTMETTHKVVTDEDDDEKHIHTEKVESTKTAPGEEHKTVDKKVVETGPGMHSETVVHEETFHTTETPAVVAKADDRVVTTVDHRVEDGVKIHEEKKTTKGDDGSVETTHKVVTDKDDNKKHIHTEKVESTKKAPGEERKRFDKRIVETGPGMCSRTVVHEETYVRTA
eukprot:TRINITY_DN4_c0_g2_i1.p1 TRINITY_DN4_c0_g2~~TRINITY_DN4_c0_g2_i1.p1  ORF type:complete len:226 (+),score=93.89 TRINITY_DN4_c0_g2_i1:65-679(+)